MYFGPYEDPRLTLRDGDPAPHFPAGVTLGLVGGMSTSSAMNDVGDIVGPTEITGPDIVPGNNIVLWLRCGAIGEWIPLLRTGDVINGRVVYAEDAGAMGRSYENKTGGSDGQPQSFNDDRQLAIRLEFTDGSHGVFLISVTDR